MTDHPLRPIKTVSGARIELAPMVGFTPARSTNLVLSSTSERGRQLSFVAINADNIKDLIAMLQHALGDIERDAGETP